MRVIIFCGKKSGGSELILFVQLRLDCAEIARFAPPDSGGIRGRFLLNEVPQRLEFLKNCRNRLRQGGANRIAQRLSRFKARARDTHQQNVLRA